MSETETENENPISIFQILQDNPRQGLARCGFRVVFADATEPDKTVVIDFESPAWNMQSMEDFLKSATVTGFDLWAKHNSAEYSIDGILAKLKTKVGARSITELEKRIEDLLEKEARLLSALT